MTEKELVDKLKKDLILKGKDYNELYTLKEKNLCKVMNNDDDESFWVLVFDDEERELLTKDEPCTVDVMICNYTLSGWGCGMLAKCYNKYKDGYFHPFVEDFKESKYYKRKVNDRS